MRKQTKLAVVLAAAALLAVTSASVVSASGWVQEGAEWRYQDSSGDYVTDTMKKSGETTFYLDENGYMAKDYFCEHNDQKYYFGSNGAMVKNTWVAIDPALVNDDNGRDVCWFYFQETGKAIKATSGNGTTKKKIDGKTYFFNEDGIMMTGWFDKTGERLDADDSTDFIENDTSEDVYYCGEDGVARAGWLAYTGGLADSYYIGKGDIADRATLYFYFNTSNFKRVKNDQKTINGKKYRFHTNGVMMSGWDYLEQKIEDPATWSGTKPITVKDYLGSNSNAALKYYSGEDDGHLVKKGWVYAVPSEFIDEEKHDNDEKEYFYFDNSGVMATGTQKKVNGKYYVFDANGIMKTGLVILDKQNKYAGKVDLDYTESSQLIKENYYFKGDSNVSTNRVTSPLYDNEGYSIHYYGSDGAKITGNNISIEFTDNAAQFASKNSGGFLDKKNKKFYSNGFLLKASDDIKLGIVIASQNLARKKYNRKTINHGTNGGMNDIVDGYTKQGTENYESDSYACYTASSSTDPNGDLFKNLFVVSTSGSQKKKGAFKDSDGNYWLVDAAGELRGIYDLQVRYKSTIKDCTWKTTKVVKDSLGNPTGEIKDDQYINWNEENGSGELPDATHLVSINNDYCLNFTVNDN